MHLEFLCVSGCFVFVFVCFCFFKIYFYEYMLHHLLVSDFYKHLIQDPKVSFGYHIEIKHFHIPLELQPTNLGIKFHSLDNLLSSDKKQKNEESKLVMCSDGMFYQVNPMEKTKTGKGETCISIYVIAKDIQPQLNPIIRLKPGEEC